MGQPWVSEMMEWGEMLKDSIDDGWVAALVALSMTAAAANTNAAAANANANTNANRA